MINKLIKMLEKASKPDRKVFILAMNKKACEELIGELKEAVESEYAPHIISMDEILHLGE